MIDLVDSQSVAVDSQSVAVDSQSVAGGNPPKKKGKKARAACRAEICEVHDDDSQVDTCQVGQPDFPEVQKTLLRDEDLQAGLLSFTVRGIFVELEVLKNNTRMRIEISNAVADYLTDGARRLLGEVRVLQHGRLARLPESASCALVLPLVHVQSDAALGGRILSCNNVFFNFLLKQWQPMSRLGVYMPGGHVLYCVFTPADDALFIKVGYRALGESKRETIIAYVEKKTERLRITNVPGAGIFVMPLPQTHKCFADPAKAAEESLKSAIRASPWIIASPSSYNGELISFSQSMEYYFIKAQAGEGSSLQALVNTLKDFTGDPNLQPLRSLMTPGPFRAGRRRLYDWKGSYESPILPGEHHSSGSSQPKRWKFPLPRLSNMCSRQKLGRFARVSILSRRRRASEEGTATAKKRRRVMSCPSSIGKRDDL